MRSERHGAKPTAPERIVAIRPGALGDTLLLFPTLALLRHAFPATRITLVARRDVLPLARASGLVDETSPYDDPLWSALFVERPPADAAARAMLSGATALAWLDDPDGGIAGNLKALGASQVVITPARPAGGSREHTALLLARALLPLGIEAPASLAALYAGMQPLAPPREDERQASVVWQRLGLTDTVAGVVALHPGSGGATKRWLPERFAALASAVLKLGYTPLLLAGPQDATLAEIVANSSREALAIAHDLSVGTLAAILRRCSAYIGNDSGVTHLAGMLGLPTLALFGPTDPAQWAPLGPHVQIVRAPDGQLQQLDTAEVVGAFALLLRG